MVTLAGSGHEGALADDDVAKIGRECEPFPKTEKITSLHLPDGNSLNMRFLTTYSVLALYQGTTEQLAEKHAVG
jgi:hypothetical protein